MMATDLSRFLPNELLRRPQDTDGELDIQLVSASTGNAATSPDHSNGHVAVGTLPVILAT